MFACFSAKTFLINIIMGHFCAWYKSMQFLMMLFQALISVLATLFWNHTLPLWPQRLVENHLQGARAQQMGHRVSSSWVHSRFQTLEEGRSSNKANKLRESTLQGCFNLVLCSPTIGNSWYLLPKNCYWQMYHTPVGRNIPTFPNSEIVYLLVWTQEWFHI